MMLLAAKVNVNPRRAKRDVVDVEFNKTKCCEGKVENKEKGEPEK